LETKLRTTLFLVAALVGAFPAAAQLLPGNIRPDPQRPPAFTGMRTGDMLWR